MRGTTKIIATLFLLAILGVLAALIFLPGQPANPVYNGRRLGDWVKVWGTPLQIPGSPFVLQNKLNTLDSNAAPYLVSVLHRHDGPWAKWYMRQWPTLPAWLRQRLPQPVSADQLRANAFDMLAHTGPGSPKTIAALLEIAQSDGDGKSVSSPAIRSLGLIGGQSQPAVDFLVQRVLAGKETQDPVESISALKQMCHHGTLGMQGLVRVIRESGDSTVCDIALDDLQELVPERPEAMDALLSFVRKNEKPWNMRWDAMMSATRAKDPNSAGMRAVIAVALDDNEEISARIQACQVMDWAHGRTSSLFPDGKPRKTVDVIAEIRARANAELDSLNAPQNPSPE